ncbi:MAG: O-antigen ligase family protein, partial [Proteobacteria bacterium]|nr:O-antigen ligase family protein [Pseudomonadota bacterium]
MFRPLEFALLALLLVAVVTGGVHVLPSFAISWGAVACAIYAVVARRRALQSETPEDAEARFLGFGGLGWMLLGMILATSLSLIPLPLPLLNILSPHAAAAYREIWSLLDVPRGWGTLSVSTAATAYGLWGLLGAWGIAFAASFAFRRRAALRRGYRTFLFFGLIAAAMLGIRYVTDLSFTAESGLFRIGPPTNDNHASAVLVLLSLTALGGCLGKRPDTHDAAGRRGLWWVLYGIFSIFLILLQSRGAIWAWMMGHIFLVAIHLGRAWLRPSRTILLLAGAMLCTLIVTAIVSSKTIGSLKTAYQETQLLPDSASVADDETPMGVIEKTHMYSDFVDLIADWKGRGYGRSAFIDVYPQYQSFPFQKTFRHAENEYFEVIMEFGLPLGLALLAMGTLGWLQLLRTRSKKHEDRFVLPGMMAGTFAVILQNFFDFSLRYWTVALPTWLILGMLAGRTQYLKYRQNQESAKPHAPGRIRLIEYRVGLGVAGFGLLVGLFTFPWALEGLRQTRLSQCRTLASQGISQIEDVSSTLKACLIPHAASAQVRQIVGIGLVRATRGQDPITARPNLIQARAWYESALKRAPQSTDIAHLLGKTCHALGDEACAAEAYIRSAKNDRIRRALAMESAAGLSSKTLATLSLEDPALVRPLTLHLIQRRRFDDALDLIQRYQHNTDDVTFSDVMRFEIYRAMGFPEGCELIAEPYAQRPPTPLTFPMRAQWLVDTRQYDALFAWIQEASPVLKESPNFQRLQTLYTVFYGMPYYSQEQYASMVPPMLLQLRQLAHTHPSWRYDEALCEAEFARRIGQNKR